MSPRGMPADMRQTVVKGRSSRFLWNQYLSKTAGRGSAFTKLSKKSGGHPGRCGACALVSVRAWWYL